MNTNQTYRILLVDDSSMLRKILTNCVIKFSKENKINIDIAEAGDGSIALKYCKATVDPVDIIFLDWNMPVMNGMTFFEEMKKLSKYKHTIVIMCSTEGGREDIIQAIANGITDYIIKPFTYELFYDHFKRLIDMCDSLKR